MTDTTELRERLADLQDYWLNAYRPELTNADCDTLAEAVSTLQASERTLTRLREWAEGVTMVGWRDEEGAGRAAVARDVLAILDGEGEA